VYVYIYIYVIEVRVECLPVFDFEIIPYNMWTRVNYYYNSPVFRFTERLSAIVARILTNNNRSIRFQDVELVEALWKVDLDCGSTATADENCSGSPPYGGFVDVGSLLLPGDEPPSRNHTFSGPSCPANPRWFLPPFNSSDAAIVGVSSLPVSGGRPCAENVFF